MASIDEAEGARAFGLNVAGYSSSRPEYPGWMFDCLVDLGVLREDISVVEIGPGNGLATRRLIESGVKTLTLVEPDERFAALLDSFAAHTELACHVIYEPFEKADLQSAKFDLALIATTFHWLDPHRRIDALARVVKPGGFVALLWNVFQDIDAHDAFHEATKDILSHLANSPSGAPDTVPFALREDEREGEFIDSGEFETVLMRQSRWKYEVKGNRVRDLYEGFSGIARLPEQQRLEVLDSIQEVADTQFDGVVERNMTSVLYLFQRT